MALPLIRIVPYGYLVLALIALILSIITLINLSTSDYTYMQALGENWGVGPITSINANNLICNQSETNILNDEWQGTKEGCHCPHSLDFVYGDVREGRCKSKRDSFIFCSTIRPIQPIKYTLWRGRQICIKRMDTNYLDLTIASSDKSCPLNTKSCGKADTLGNVICVQNKADCPLTDLKVLVQSQQTGITLS
jgi:hypothetical protein